MGYLKLGSQNTAMVLVYKTIVLVWYHIQKGNLVKIKYLYIFIVSRAALIIPMLWRLKPLVCQCFIDLHPFLVRSHDHPEHATICAALNPEELYLSNQENE